jgi:Transport and Golgi organisation 2
MCTVSWVPGPEGYTLCFNRDERHTRAAALEPERREARGVAFLAPLDGDFGGTWFLVNEHGLTLCLLNRYQVPDYVPPPQPTSRGVLLLSLAPHRQASAALAELGTRSLVAIQPFTIVAVQPNDPPSLAAWDGRRLTLTRHPDPGLLLTSSAVTEPDVAAARTALFAGAGPFTPEVLTELHRSHIPERGRRSVCMHRDDAETQSFSRVTVDPLAITLVHIPDAPCRGTALPPLSLDRHRLPSPIQR